MEDMALERAKIGMLVPSANTRSEPDFVRMMPEGVTVHAARLFITEATCEALARMNEDIEQGAKYLATAEVDVIAFCCTGGSFFRGVGYDREVSALIQSAAHIPAVTTSTAVVEALKTLGVRTMAMATPYPKELNDIEKKFMEDSGLRVVSLKGLEIVKAPAIAQVPPSQVYQLAKEVDRREADGIFISCTNFRGVDVIDRLERELGKPVVTSNQATFWAALRALGIREARTGYGRLMEQYLLG